MFWKKMKGREDAIQWKWKQEFIHRQEESAVQMEAGGKLVMKKVWELGITSMT